MNRYPTGKFTGQYRATIGADFLTKEVVVTDAFGQRHVVVLQIWDTDGQERFQSLGVAFYRGADGAVLVYDVTDLHSLDNIQHWQQEFLQHVGGRPAGAYDAGMVSDQVAQFPFLVVGKKADKVQDWLVPAARAEEWCTEAARSMQTQRMGAGAGGGAGGNDLAARTHSQSMCQPLTHMRLWGTGAIGPPVRGLQGAVRKIETALRAASH